MFIEVTTITKDTLKDVLEEFDFKLLSLFGTEIFDGIKLTSSELVNFNFVSRIYEDTKSGKTVLEFSDELSIYVVESVGELIGIINSINS